MGTGVVSLDLASDGSEWLSRLLLVLAAVAWLALLARGGPARSVAGVAATAVLGNRLARLGWTAAAWPLLGAASALWVVQLRRFSWSRPAAGSAFLPAVATQSLAVLSATLAATVGGRWLQVAGLALLAGGLALYVAALPAFDLRELRRGRGDQWIAGGALAISGLACAELGSGGTASGALRVLGLVLWGAAIAWLPALIAGELLRPRRDESPSRWSTVFPIGMYAATSFAVGRLADLAWMRDFARGWTWVAVTVWALVAIDAAIHAPGMRRTRRR